MRHCVTQSRKTDILLKYVGNKGLIKYQYHTTIDTAVYELFFLESRVNIFIGCLSTLFSRNETLGMEVPKERYWEMASLIHFGNSGNKGCERMFADRLHIHSAE